MYIYSSNSRGCFSSLPFFLRSSCFKVCAVAKYVIYSFLRIFGSSHGLICVLVPTNPDPRYIFVGVSAVSLVDSELCFKTDKSMYSLHGLSVRMCFSFHTGSLGFNKEPFSSIGFNETP
jgi:hypothetical protein